MKIEWAPKKKERKKAVYSARVIMFVTTIIIEINTSAKHN